MAEIQQRPLNLVRDMYEGGNPVEMTGSQRKAHRNENLRNNPDVLFKVYQEGNLHMVFLSTTGPGVWMMKIQDRITTQLSFQMTKKRTENNIFKITMSGRQEELQHFCDDFHQLHDEVMTITLDEGAATPNDPQDNDDGEDDVEELRERIRELELENRNLRRR